MCFNHAQIEDDDDSFADQLNRDESPNRDDSINTDDEADVASTSSYHTACDKTPLNRDDILASFSGKLELFICIEIIIRYHN